MTQATRATSMKRGLLGMALAAAVALVLVICLGRTGQAPSAFVVLAAGYALFFVSAGNRTAAAFGCLTPFGCFSAADWGMQLFRS